MGRSLMRRAALRLQLLPLWTSERVGRASLVGRRSSRLFARRAPAKRIGRATCGFPDARKEAPDTLQKRLVTVGSLFTAHLLAGSVGTGCDQNKPKKGYDDYFAKALHGTGSFPGGRSAAAGMAEELNLFGLIVPRNGCTSPPFSRSHKVNRVN